MLQVTRKSQGLPITIHIPRMKKDNFPPNHVAYWSISEASSMAKRLEQFL